MRHAAARACSRQRHAEGCPYALTRTEGTPAAGLMRALGGEHLRGSLTDVLDCRAFESGPVQDARVQPFDLRALVADVVGARASQPTTRGLVLSVDRERAGVAAQSVGEIRARGARSSSHLIGNAVSSRSAARCTCVRARGPRAAHVEVQEGLGQKKQSHRHRGGNSCAHLRRLPSGATAVSTPLSGSPGSATIARDLARAMGGDANVSASRVTGPASIARGACRGPARACCPCKARRGREAGRRPRCCRGGAEAGGAGGGRQPR